MGSGKRTLLLVYTEDDDDLIAAHTDELLYRSDTSPGELGQKNHSLDAIILQLYRFCQLPQPLHSRHLESRTNLT